MLCILFFLTYGAETWSLTKYLEMKLTGAQKGMERKCWVYYADRKRALLVWQQTKVEVIAVTKKKKDLGRGSQKKGKGERKGNEREVDG